MSTICRWLFFWLSFTSALPLLTHRHHDAQQAPEAHGRNVLVRALAVSARASSRIIPIEHRQGIHSARCLEGSEAKAKKKHLCQ